MYFWHLQSDNMSEFALLLTLSWSFHLSFCPCSLWRALGVCWLWSRRWVQWSNEMHHMSIRRPFVLLTFTNTHLVLTNKDGSWVGCREHTERVFLSVGFCWSVSSWIRSLAHAKLNFRSASSLSTRLKRRVVSFLSTDWVKKVSTDSVSLIRKVKYKV